MRIVLACSLILVALCFSLLIIPQANALPVSYNTTTINLGLSSSVRNSSSYDVFPLIPDNWLWLKFDNTTSDSSFVNFTNTITYNSNLKGMYHFQSNVLDSTTNTNNGVFNGTTTYVSGHEGNGIFLNGASEVTTVNTAYSFDRLNTFSISFWMRANNTGGIIIDKNVPGFYGTAGYGIYNNGAGFIDFEIGNNAGNEIRAQSSLSSNSNDNIWHFYTFTYDGSGFTKGVKIYQDSTQLSVTSIMNSSSLGATNTKKLTIGGGVTGANFTPKGTNIDEVRIYNAILTQDQVSALYEVDKYSQSHTFDGGETISYGSAASWAFLSNGSPFTISTWAKFTSGSFLGPTSVPELFDTSNGGAGLGYTWYINTNGAIITLITNAPLTNAVSLTSAAGVAPTDGLYHYYAETFDGNTLSLYKDGTLVTTASRTLTLSSSNPSTALIVGSRSTVANYLIGQLDNAKIYPYVLSPSQISTDQSLGPVSSGKQFMSYYNGVSGSSTLTNKLGPGSASLTLACSPTSTSQFLIANNIGIDYICPGAASHTFYSNNIMSNTNSILWHTPSAGIGAFSTLTGFVTKTKLMSFTIDDGLSTVITTSSGNTTLGGIPSSETVSNQKVHINGQGMFKYHFNGTALVANSGTDCDLLYLPTNTTKSIDSIACDRSVPANTIRYWNGMNIQGSAIYYTNSTFPFLTSIDNNSYKKLLSLPCEILVNENPCETFIASDFLGNDNLIVLTSTHVYFKNAAQANSILLTHNYALQSYDVVTTTTTSAYQIPNNPLLQSMRLFGFNVNQTLTKTGLFTIPSSNSFISTTLQPAIRLIDPRWTNDATDIPVIYTTSSLFPIFLTASNAPSFAAIKVTQGNQIINGQEAVYAVAQLDSTRSVEFDLPPGDCANIYIADISVSPSIWNFQGIICATGVNQKTIAYTNTVPFTFYTLKYGVTDSFTPANNGLTTTFRTSVAPTTYTVIIKNSTGTTAINQTFTIPANQTIDTRNFNVSGVTKPAALSVLVAGNQVYSAYLGSPLSLANMASFFHQYFNYQGFDFLSFIPIVFASAFTRNTVGVGMALTVICIATLSWLSIVVVPDQIIYVSIFVAILGMVGYRAYGYL